MSATHSEERKPGTRRRRLWPLGLTVSIAVVLGAAIWLVVTGFLAAREAQTLSASLGRLEASAGSLDVKSAAAALPVARESAHRLNQLTSGPPWWVAERLPKVGATVRSARALASAVDGLLSAAQPLEPALDAVASGQLRTAEGGLNLGLVLGSTAGLRATAAAVPAAEASLDQIEPETLPAQLATSVASARKRLPELVSIMSGAADTAERMLPLLGSEGPRTWLVLLQNPSEARGTGGFIGGYALVTADNGKLTLTHAGANDELTRHQPIDYSALPQETQALWGRDLAEWQSITLSPHFPYAAQLAAQGIKQMNQKVDGVVSVDPQVVSWILAATGPVTVAGRTVTAETAADYVTRQVYVDNSDSTAKDVALLSLLTQALQHLTSGSVDLATLASGLGPLVEGHHLQLWSARAAEQAWLEESPIAGVISDKPGPSVVVGLNNGAGNKVDAFIYTAARYTLGNCSKVATQTSTLTLTLRNDAPPPGTLPKYATVRNDNPNAPRAGERMLVAVYGPVGALLMDSSIDGKPEPVGGGTDRGRPVWQFEMEVDPDQSRSLTLHFTEPSAAAGATPSLQLPPMVNAPELAVGTTTNCPA